MSKQESSSLSQHIHLLGELLGQTLKEQAGEPFYKKVELVRRLAKSARVQGFQSSSAKSLKSFIRKQPPKELLLFARAFSHFLNLANIAESYESLTLSAKKNKTAEELIARGSLQELFTQLLKNKKTTKKKLYQALTQLDIGLVLTAHPTEVKRRTLIRMLARIEKLLKAKEKTRLTLVQQESLTEELHAKVTEIWQTDEIRRHRPTPVEEAKWGFAIIEDSLWEAIPQYLRELDKTVLQICGKSLPIDFTPFHFGSWMGGDRDGNPTVTASVTYEVCLLSRWMVVDLYARDLIELIQNLSMRHCNQELRKKVGKEAIEPYRVLFKKLRRQLLETRSFIEKKLKTPTSFFKKEGLVWDQKTLLEPLLLCYHSLCECNGESIANQKALDLIRNVYCFGVTLTKLDLRQEAERHTQLLSEVTKDLELGDYSVWTESQKIKFLVKEIKNKRPLIPYSIKLNKENQETLETFRLIATDLYDNFGAYVISMASNASDILAVLLLQKSVGVKKPLRIVPLFETLSDLNRSPEIMDALFSIPVYLSNINSQQEVMIGYSDSGKDAGKLSAAWAQYQAQEGLARVAKANCVELSLFHGRGGSVGRGGGPIHLSLQSQPPQSVSPCMRVTEQGEVIQQKFGFTELGIHNLKLYTSAVVSSLVDPPVKPKPAWCHLMDKLSQASLTTYKEMLEREPKFIEYFHAVTPERELNHLYIGSRPARRKKSGGIASLRAIPWVFAWTQVRLNLPAWLGVGKALTKAIKQGKKTELQSMIQNWPFFDAFMDMLDMVLVKSDAEITKFYEDCLASKDLKEIGSKLRAALNQTIEANNSLLSKLPCKKSRTVYRASIHVRNTYADPINLIQAEVMRRLYQTTLSEKDRVMLEDALMVTIAGIAAAMKNTG